jgi:hypothetical protein
MENDCSLFKGTSKMLALAGGKYLKFFIFFILLTSASCVPFYERVQTDYIMQRNNKKCDSESIKETLKSIFKDNFKNVYDYKSSFFELDSVYYMEYENTKIKPKIEIIKFVVKKSSCKLIRAIIVNH